MNLSKSKYTRFCQCPKMLWLDKYHPELAQVDQATQQRFEAGNEAGDIAMGLFGKFTEVTTTNADGSLNIPAMLAKTKTLVEQGEENICEASFSAHGCYCAVDILHKQDDGYAIYEVKSSTHVAEVYLWDVAYQKWVLQNAGINVTGTYVVHINNKYERHGEVDIGQLFTIVDVAKDVAPYFCLVEGNIANARQYLKQTEEPARQLGTHCANPYDCAYWNYCGRDIPSPSVFDLYRIPFEKACKLYNSGVVTLSDVLASGIELSEKQFTQVEFAVKDMPQKVDKGGVQEFLNRLWYPLYFLDFETYQTPVPMFDGMRPFQQIPFQYSLHYIEHEGGALHHTEFLGDENADPRRAIAESLVANIPQGACVLAYNMAFERSRIDELAQSFPDIASELLCIKSNIRDLLDVFRGGHIYNQAMGGSFSIKSVLPAMFPNNPKLNYHNLEDVHNGSEATNTFLALRQKSPEERTKLRHSLLEYCKLDTHAMVVLWEKLIELSK